MSLCPKCWSFEHLLNKKLTVFGSKRKMHVQNGFFQSGTLPSSVYTDVIHLIKWTRPSSFFLHTANNQKLVSGEDREQGYSSDTKGGRTEIRLGGGGLAWEAGKQPIIRAKRLGATVPPPLSHTVPILFHRLQMSCTCINNKKFNVLNADSCTYLVDLKVFQKNFLHVTNSLI